MSGMAIRSGWTCDNCGETTPVDGLKSFRQVPPGRYSDHTIELCSVCAANANWEDGEQAPESSTPSIITLVNRYGDCDAVTRVYIDRLINAVATSSRAARLSVNNVLSEATKHVHLAASQGLRTDQAEEAKWTNWKAKV